MAVETAEQRRPLAASLPRWRAGSACLCVLLALLVLWAAIAQVDIVVVAPGRLVPESYLKIVQPAEAGVVREILVREGDHVPAGKVLASLDPTLHTADRATVTRELAVAELTLRRIEAELGGMALERRAEDDAALFAPIVADFHARRQAHRDAVMLEEAVLQRATLELKAQREVLAKLAVTVPVYERIADAYRRLGTGQLVARLQAEERQREAFEKVQDLKAQQAMVESLEAALRQQERKLRQLDSSYRSDLSRERVATVAAVEELRQQHAKAEYRQRLLTLRAPAAGIVKEVATTTVGAVVQPGAVLVTLVPYGEPLVAEVRLGNRDAGFVRPGQNVRLKIAAYPFQKHGLLSGTVRTISADSSPDTVPPGASPAETGLSFRTLVGLDAQALDAGAASLPLAAGMQVVAEIVQGQRTVLEYLLSPVRKIADEAARER